MALRTKTVEFAFPIQTTSLATATRSNLTAITLTLPEVTSRTFLSCEIDLMCEGGSTGATVVTSRVLGINVNSAGFDDQTLAYTPANATSTQVSYHYSRDVTAHFVTNWTSGTTATCAVGMQFAGPSTINHTIKVILTYQFDDAAQNTRVKTVRIPLDSKNGGLTTSLANIGTNQIPALDTFCPEATKTYLNMWVQFEGCNGSLGTTNSTVSFGLDLVSSLTTGTSVHTQGNAYWVRYLFDCSSMVTSTTHNVSLSASSVNYSFPSCSLVLYVTYTYSHNSSTSVLNSLVMSTSDGRCRPGIDSTNPMRYTTTFAIPESTPTLVQSAILMYGGDETMTSWSMRAGAQSYRTLTFTSGQIGDVCETLTSFRIDSGGSGGVGIALASGSNTITVDTYATGATDDDSIGVLVSPMLYLNYTSAINATYGEDAHNHTTFWASRDGYIPLASVVTNQWTPNKNFAPPEAGYYVSDFTFVPFHIIDFSSFGGSWATYAQILSSEPNGPSWMAIQTPLPVYIFGGTGDIEFPTNANAYFRRTPADTTKPDSTQSRLWRTNGTNASVVSLGARMLVTYHALTKSIGGTLSGYTGSGSGITVDVYSATTKILAGTATTSAGGAWSMSVYDGDTYFSVARQDDTHVGRSANGVGV